MNNIYCKYDWDLGSMYITLDSYGILRLDLNEDNFEQYKSGISDLVYDKYSCKKVMEELDEYFKGIRKEFTIPLSISGTTFQKMVWNELTNIPYGETKSYGEIAKNIGKPKGAQAIGQANKVNKIPIFIPCHRVISKDGNIGGYMGKTKGTEVNIKQFLLSLEKRHK
ncbi:methylated-DNA--[protein]-cysteine S-methyltransferase [Clostridium sp. MB40-C1]|uniref:methylated-DNA--[protein]-cysteine S-methyltransferase n=1 Tax=Clostridium sp. MB40-C1 TaxID=3070996 RepID=UPI0027E0AF18|nr:methylated-DNA--[protein]-cysteine S-methyltransferase [Clostridium sp. MB40-C1]WMJ79628.1 methylated-DNA--[protein]-cysteine S-methyltransferase [Clostridium sp. MB40-C1]